MSLSRNDLLEVKYPKANQSNPIGNFERGSNFENYKFRVKSQIDNEIGSQTINPHSSLNASMDSYSARDSAKESLIRTLNVVVDSLKSQLKANKIFLNMVIHDMRNPTNSIEFGIRQIMDRFIEDQ